MGTSVRSSPSIVVREQRGKNNSKWLNLDLRRRKSMPSNSPSMSMTSREMARLMPSMLVTSSVLATLTQPSRLLRRSVDSPRRARRCSPRLMSSPYKACKDSKDQGGFHDFVEILKLYDKNSDDTILEFELLKLLVNLGEKLTKEEAKSLMKELCEPADDEGFMPFSSRECALLRSKFSSQSTKFTEVTIRGRGPHLPPKNSQYSDVARLLEHLEYFFGCFLETEDSVGHIPDSCKLFNFKCLIYMRKLRIKKS